MIFSHFATTNKPTHLVTVNAIINRLLSRKMIKKVLEHLSRIKSYDQNVPDSIF